MVRPKTTRHIDTKNGTYRGGRVAAALSPAIAGESLSSIKFSLDAIILGSLASFLLATQELVKRESKLGNKRPHKQYAMHLKINKWCVGLRLP